MQRADDWRGAMADFRVLDANCPIKLESKLASLGFGPCRIKFGERECFAVSIDVASLGQLKIFGAACAQMTDLEFYDPGDAYSFCWTNDGTISFRSSGLEHQYSGPRAVVAAPKQDFSLAFGPETYLLILRVGAGQLSATLESMLRRRPPLPLLFGEQIDLSSGTAANFQRFCRMLVGDLAENGGLLSNPVGITLAEETLMHWLLLGIPHSCRQFLEQCTRTGVPSKVLRVEDYLRSNASRRVAFASIAQTENISLRGLEALFHKYRGYSPSDFLKRTRLKMARESIQKADGRSITSIALDSGFTRMGAFAHDYRVQFDEPPSTTLRRLKGPP